MTSRDALHPSRPPSLLGEVFRFEVRYLLRSPLFAISFALFFLLSFGAVTTDGVQIGGALGAVNRNAPYVVMQFMLVMSAIGVWVSTAFVAGAVNRDFDLDTHALFFTTRLSKRDYLLGRYAGSLAASFLVFLAVAAAIRIGAAMPWLEPERVGPNPVAAYAFALLVLVLPNVIVTGTVFFSIASFTRSRAWTYVGVVVFFVGYAIGSTYLEKLEDQFVAALVDPFGFGAFEIATKYWTVAERNGTTFFLDRALVWNRLLWLAVAAAVLAFTYSRFRFEATVASRGRARRGDEERGGEAPGADLPEPVASPAARPSPPAVSRRFDLRAQVAALHLQARIETRSVLRSAPFLVILCLAVFNVVGASSAIDELYGTSVYPVTHLMLRVIRGSFSVFALLIVTFYSGELVHRERSLRLDGVYDSLPVPSWVFWGAKSLALAAVVGVLVATALATGVGIQAWQGYHQFELSLYLRELVLVVGHRLLLLAALAVFVQTVANEKYLGFLVVVVYYISDPVLTALDYEHHLYRYATSPQYTYSDMNGYGPFVRPLVAFGIYGSCLAAALVVLTHALWVRGTPGTARQRVRAAVRSLRGRTAGAALALSLLGALACGGYIYWNTNVLNRYLPSDVVEKRQLDYEKRYRGDLALPHPKIVAVKAEVDLVPEERRTRIRGTYTLRNKTAEPIDTLRLSLDPEVRVTALAAPGSREVSADAELGYRVLKLAAPLLPSEETELAFDLAVENRGFRNEREPTKIVANGTFFDSFDYFPHIGYVKAWELQDPNARRKAGLPPVQRMPPRDDPRARYGNALSSEADWIRFETTVSTSPDQVALAPGYLKREWTENGRRYFRYEMDAPILAFWAYLSARYEVRRDAWNGVAIEVYFDPKHGYNVDRMIDAVKKSLALFTARFGPYQHRQLRILEFPRYARFAQSFPNTVPFSESIGFIARLEDPEDIDYVFYVTAHEVAHQWWAHQVIGGNVQGATVLSETLSQHSALEVMEQEYGRPSMRRFLKYELEGYLRGRGAERIEELPLALVEDQGYIHYRKGSLAMYALRDAAGAEALDAAIRRFRDAHAYEEPPYTYTRDFLAELRTVVPADRPHLIEDLFETITLYDLKASRAEATKRSDGRWAVRIDVAARKLRATGKGVESEIAIDDWMDVGVFGAKGEGTPREGKPLRIEKRHVGPETRSFELVVDEEPVKAGIDPLNILIDRNPEDNLVAVSVAAR